MAPSGRKRSKASAAAAAGRQWKVGDLVLAKVKGFQSWPAMVSEPEKWGYAADWKKVLVCFFGTQQIAFCNPVDVEAFTEEKKQSMLRKRHGKYSDFGRALSEIIDAFEKLKKDEVNNSSDDTYEDPMVSENNTPEVLTESVSSVKSPLITSKPCRGKTVSSGTHIDVIIKSGIDFDDANSNEGLSEREVPSEDVRFGINVAERNFITTCSTRRRSERSHASKSSVSRRPPFRHRRSSRVDDIEVDSSDVVSNCTSAEGNDSGILTVDSDAFFCKDGSDAEWDSKPVQPVVVTGLDQPNNELGQMLDFQTNTIINKKKRKPIRKRPSNESLEYTYKVDMEKVSDISVIRNGMILPSEHENSPERCLREDDDAHLPFLKRAKVRMSQALSIGDEPNSSQSSEEKQLEESRSISDQVRWSLHGEIDSSTDKDALHCSRDSDKSPPPYREPVNPSVVQEVNTTVASGNSMDVEAVLPPSKRLHRALEAMSANAAQDDEISVAGSNVNCTYFSGDLRNLTEIRRNSSLTLGNDEELYKTTSQVGPFESPSRPKTYQNIGDSSGHESPINGDHSLDSSFTEIKDAAVVECSKSLSPNVFIKVSNIRCGTGPPCGAMSCDDGCKTMTTILIEPFVKSDLERCPVTFNVISRTNIRIQSPYNDSCGTTKSCEMTVENFKDPRELKCEENVVESEPAERRSEPSSSPALHIELNGEDQFHSGNISGHLAHSTSFSDDHSSEKFVSVNQSSSLLTDGLDPVSHAMPHTLAGNTSASDNVSVLLNGSCSSGVRCFTVVNGATIWNCKEAQVNLSAFEAILGTLTRTKECIGRATRLAIDCATCGVASMVVEVIAHNLEKEPSMHRRVDLFFLVDSIAQFSNGLKGDIGGVYPSAILAVLPQLLSAAAPPGIGSQENRRQCLKVLRVWLERRILPETTIRNHIRELDSFGSASCSRASRRSYRNERAFDDPVREMAGMLVDEYGSNSSFQLPGFCMPPMLRDEDDEVDSDGESFEAVTPEHDVEKSEVEKIQASAVGKLTHILKHIDGELEMEDVAPTEDFASGIDVSGMNGIVTPNFLEVNSVSFVVAPPLHVDSRSTSPPPPPPPPRLLEKTDSITKSFKTCSQVPYKKPEPANCSPFRNRYIPLPHDKSSQTEGFDKGFRLPPPHPAPSNQFSYVQNQRSKSRRDIPHSSNSNGYHMPNTGNRNFYRDNDRMRFPPRGFQERWRGSQHFPDYHEGSRISYPPPHFGAQHCDPSFPKHRWSFPSRPVSHQGYMRHRPSSEGTNFWRPR